MNAIQKIKSARSTGFQVQAYAANIKGGTPLVSGQIKYEDLFSRSVNDGGYSKIYTNLDNAGRINQGEKNTILQYGIRVGHLLAVTPTPAQLDAMAQFLANCRVQMFVGPNATKILDLEGAHFMSPVTGVSAVVGFAATPVNMTSWITLPGELKQILSENVNIKASVECELPGGTPAALAFAGPGVPNFYFNLILAGRREVMS